MASRGGGCRWAKGSEFALFLGCVTASATVVLPWFVLQRCVAQIILLVGLRKGVRWDEVG